MFRVQHRNSGPSSAATNFPLTFSNLEGFSDILSNYYTEQDIGELYRNVQPLYDREIERLHDPIAGILFEASTYLRALVDPAMPKTFSVIVEPLVGRITNVRSFTDHYAIILSGSDEIPTDVVRHAYLHFLLDGLPLQYPHVVAVKRPLYEVAAKAPRLESGLQDDFSSWFEECTVRAVEIKLKKMSPSEKEAALQSNDEDGYVLVRPIFMGLTGYEKSEPAFRNYFPDLVRGIDLKAEQTRVAAIHFAPAQEAAQAKGLNGEDLARKRVHISTLPDDPEAIAALTDGEKELSRKIRAPRKLLSKAFSRSIPTSRAPGMDWAWLPCWITMRSGPKRCLAG